MELLSDPIVACGEAGFEPGWSDFGAPGLHQHYLEVGLDMLCFLFLHQ